MSDINIKVNENGPYVIMGNATYIDADGNEQTTPGKAIALCRCGHSANKPFCDGAHNKEGFTAPGLDLTLKTDN